MVNFYEIFSFLLIKGAFFHIPRRSIPQIPAELSIFIFIFTFHTLLPEIIKNPLPFILFPAEKTGRMQSYIRPEGI